MQTSNPSWQRQNNLAVLTRAVWRNPEISRRDLAQRFLIDKSSISRLVQLLMGLGLVESVGPLDQESDSEVSLGGRKRIGLRVSPGFGQVWGLSLNDVGVRLTALDASGRILKECGWPLEWREDWNQTLVGVLKRTVQEMGTLVSPLLGIGFAMPGWIDFSQEKVIRSVNLGLEDMKGLTGLRSRLRLPLVWENDANCGAWSCLDPASDQPGKDLIYVLGRYKHSQVRPDVLELAVGFGLIVGDSLYRGKRFRAGEFRSALWSSENHSQFGVSDPDYFASMEDEKAFYAVADDLARNLVLVSELLDSGTVIVGGDLKRRWQTIADCVARRVGEFSDICKQKQDVLNEMCWDEVHYPEQSIAVSPAPFLGDEVSLGAARLMLDELFQIPSATHRHSLFQGYGSGVDDPLWCGVKDWDELFKV